MFVFNHGQHSKVVDPGVSRKRLGEGGSLMMTEVVFEKGAVGSLHTHPHEQVSYIVQGSFEFTLNEEKQILKKGDSVYIPSNVKHGVVALENQSIILDVFTAQREDFKD